MKLLYKLLIINFLIPVAAIYTVVMVMINKDHKAAEIRSQQELTFQMENVVSILEGRIFKKEQYIEDLAKLSLNEKLYNEFQEKSVDSDYTDLKSYKLWSDVFSGLGANSAGADYSFLKFKESPAIISENIKGSLNYNDSEIDDLYATVAAKKTFILSKPILNRERNFYTASFLAGYPVYGEAESGNNRIIGIVGIEFSLTETVEILSSFEKKRLS